MQLEWKNLGKYLSVYRVLYQILIILWSMCKILYLKRTTIKIMINSFNKLILLLRSVHF